MTPLDYLRNLEALLRAIHDSLDLVARIRALAEQSEPFLTGAFVNLFATTGDPATGRAFVDSAVIREFHPAVLVLANAGLIGVGVWSGYRMMWSHSLRNQHTLRILLPRLVLAIALVNFALPLVQHTVDASNTMSAAIGRDSVRLMGQAAISDLRHDIGLPALSFIATAALFAGYLVLAVAYVTRYALLVILAILSPLAALCFVLHETQHYAREWASLYVATLLMQPLQLLILAIGFRLEGSGASPVRHLYALAALLISFKVPGALHAASSAGTRAASFAERQAGHLAHLAARGA